MFFLALKLSPALLQKVWVSSFGIILIGRRFVWTFWTVLLLTVKWSIWRICHACIKVGQTDDWACPGQLGGWFSLCQFIHSFRYSIEILRELPCAASQTSYASIFSLVSNFLYSFHCVQSNILAFGLQYPTQFSMYLLGDSFLNDKHLIRWILTQAAILLSVMFLKGLSVKQKFVGVFILSSWYSVSWNGLVNWSTEKFSEDDPTSSCCENPSRKKWMSLLDLIMLLSRQVIGIRNRHTCLVPNYTLLYCWDPECYFSKRCGNTRFLQHNTDCSQEWQPLSLWDTKYIFWNNLKCSFILWNYEVFSR